MSRTERSIAIGVITVAAVMTYRTAFSAYFFNDDLQWLVGSWAFDPANLFRFDGMTHFYRPVLVIYFGWVTPLFQGSPVLFHAANIAMHVANGILVFAIARMISRRTVYTFAAALFFVVQPNDIDAVAWVGALGEPLGAMFGCVSLLGFLHWRRSGSPIWRWVSVAAYALALLTHESSVVFLPVLMLADWAFIGGGSGKTIPDDATKGVGRLRQYAPYLAVTVVYLAIDLSINSRNYLVKEGHYALGWHVVSNTLDYLVALYVGRRDTLNYAVAALTIVALLLRGHRRVLFATLWTLMALAPFVSFTWGNTSRYLYQPAIGFSLLLAEAMVYLDRVLEARVTARVRRALVACVIAGIGWRFMLFASRNVAAFADHAEAYRRHAVLFRAAHGDLPSHAVIAADPELKAAFAHAFASALVQWEYQDPTIQLVPYD